MISCTDSEFRNILEHLIQLNVKVNTRNHETLSSFIFRPSHFKELPLVTVRKTAWKKALLEMEWFMSGESKCPEELMDWWAGQLNPDNRYIAGYGEQLRKRGYRSNVNGLGWDQIYAQLKNIKEHPASRRLIMTTWEPLDMEIITTLNRNNHTPTNCHGTLSQFFVRDGVLSLKTYQRSADILLGVPHNWVQYWALLTYFAHHTGNAIGELIWIFGDLHLYTEESHMKAANEILALDPHTLGVNKLKFIYTYSGDVHLGCPKFKASDFIIEGIIPTPMVTTRPRLLA